MIDIRDILKPNVDIKQLSKLKIDSKKLSDLIDKSKQESRWSNKQNDLKDYLELHRPMDI